MKCTLFHFLILKSVPLKSTIPECDIVLVSLEMVNGKKFLLSKKKYLSNLIIINKIKFIEKYRIFKGILLPTYFFGSFSFSLALKPPTFKSIKKAPPANTPPRSVQESIGSQIILACFGVIYCQCDYLAFLIFDVRACVLLQYSARFFRTWNWSRHALGEKCRNAFFASFYVSAVYTASVKLEINAHMQ